MPETVIHEVKIYEFDADYRLRAISRAKSGEYQRENLWRLKDVVQTRFEEDRTTVSRIPEAYWRSVLNPSILNVLMVVPEQMSLLDLISYIEHLSENHQETSRYEIVLWQKIIYPFAVLVMMVLALPFAYFQVREGGVSGKIFTGIMLGLVFHLWLEYSLNIPLFQWDILSAYVLFIDPDDLRRGRNWIRQRADVYFH